MMVEKQSSADACTTVDTFRHGTLLTFKHGTLPPLLVPPLLCTGDMNCSPSWKQEYCQLALLPLPPYPPQLLIVRS
jgi:hypothetical protein